MREPLQEFRRAAFLHPRTAVDDEVLLQAGRMDALALERDRDTRVAAPSALSVTRWPSAPLAINSRALAGSTRRV